MNFKDVWATDENGRRFVFTVEMQRRLSEAGLPVEPASLAALEGERGPSAAPPPAARPAENAPRSAPKQSSKPAPKQAAEFQEPASIQIDPNTDKYIGRVKWFNQGKGYGFIARGGNEQIFFHRSDIACDPDDLVDGTWVLYDVEETEKGFEANEVELFDGEG